MFTNPKRNLLQCGDMTGLCVADLGAGSGFYTLASAERVGSQGRVYSIDIQKNLLEKIRQQASEKKLDNIEYIWGDIESKGGTKLADSVINVAIVSNVLFQIENRNSFIYELARIIKPGGQVLFVDWVESFNNLGPHKNHIIDESHIRKLFEKHGFQLKDRIDAGEHHYGIIFTYEK